MDIQYLCEFVVLAELCNYQEAAEALHVSQSALSKHIQKLEEGLDKPLFERSARTVTLSRFGEALLPYARQIAELRREALQHLQRIRMEDLDRLVVACPPALERYGVVELLAGFRRLHPETTVEKLPSVDPVGALRAGRCDFAFAQTDLRDKPDILGKLYREDYPVAVLPEDHPLAQADSVTMEQLREERFILHNRAEESTTVPQVTLTKLCDAAGFAPKIAMSANFSSTIVSLVGQGLGVTVMQRLQVPRDCGNVVLKRIQTDSPTDIQLIYMKSARHTPLRTEFLQYVAEPSGN